LSPRQTISYLSSSPPPPTPPSSSPLFPLPYSQTREEEKGLVFGLLALEEMVL